jgi:uncharacterized protein YdeI (YjbR/CyaY-like superfamily)
MVGMDAPELLYFKNGDQWHEWLERHHKTATDAWLVHVKKGSGKVGLIFQEALDEAIAFGWIDSKLKSLGVEGFLLRYSPRKPGSLWSKRNRDRAEELTRQGRMMQAGLASIEEARKSGKWDSAYTFLKRWEMPPDLGKALAACPAARENFEAFANSNRNQYIHWVNEAKTEATRQKRIAAVVDYSADNIKPGQI